MTKYKDLPDREIVGKFDKEQSAYKRYGEKEVTYDDEFLKNNLPMADLVAKIYRFGKDITEKEYLAK